MVVVSVEERLALLAFYNYDFEKKKKKFGPKKQPPIFSGFLKL